jgi:putative chitinase
VRRGETLSAIARRYKTTVKELMQANNLRSANRIREGQMLRVPSDGSGGGAEASVASVASDGERRHRVRRGETLSGIAVRYGTTVQALMQANNLSSRSMIKAGAWLRVPPARRSRG